MIGLGGRLAALFAGNGLTFALFAAGGIMFATWRSDIKESGRQEVRVETKRKTNEAIERGTAAADKSGGVRPPRGSNPLIYRD